MLMGDEWRWPQEGNTLSRPYSTAEQTGLGPHGLFRACPTSLERRGDKVLEMKAGLARARMKMLPTGSHFLSENNALGQARDTCFTFTTAPNILKCS